MKTSDVTQTLIIFLVFFLLFFSTILTIGVKNINDNWAKYRCNPLVMPFAGLFGYDPVDNFNYCTDSITENSLNTVLAPLNSQVNDMKEVSKQNRNTSRKLAKRQQGLLSSISSFTNQLQTLTTNMSIEMKRNSNATNQVFKKMGGIVTLFERTIGGLTKTTRSIKNTAERIPGFKKKK